MTYHTAQQHKHILTYDINIVLEVQKVAFNRDTHLSFVFINESCCTDMLLSITKEVDDGPVGVTEIRDDIVSAQATSQLHINTAYSPKDKEIRTLNKLSTKLLNM